MNGIYEHRRWFHRQYEPVLEVSKEGVLCHQNLYSWGDIEDVRRYSGTGSTGSGILVFKDGTRCFLNLQTFRKKGEEGRISFLGANQVFDQLRNHLLRKKMESLKDPRIDELQQQLDKLESELAIADGKTDMSIIEKEIVQLTREQLRLNNLYLDKLKQQGEEGRSKKMVKLALIVCILAAIVMFRWLKS